MALLPSKKPKKSNAMQMGTDQKVSAIPPPRPAALQRMQGPARYGLAQKPGQQVQRGAVGQVAAGIQQRPQAGAVGPAQGIPQPAAPRLSQVPLRSMLATGGPSQQQVTPQAAGVGIRPRPPVMGLMGLPSQPQAPTPQPQPGGGPPPGAGQMPMDPAGMAPAATTGFAPGAEPSQQPVSYTEAGPSQAPPPGPDPTNSYLGDYQGTDEAGNEVYTHTDEQGNITKYYVDADGNVTIETKDTQPHTPTEEEMLNMSWRDQLYNAGIPDEEMEIRKQEAMSDIDSRAQRAYYDAMERLAAEGMGGSGQAAVMLAEVEQGRQQAISDLHTELALADIEAERADIAEARDFALRMWQQTGDEMWKERYWERQQRLDEIGEADTQMLQLDAFDQSTETAVSNVMSNEGIPADKKQQHANWVYEASAIVKDSWSDMTPVQRSQAVDVMMTIVAMAVEGTLIDTEMTSTFMNWIETGEIPSYEGNPWDMNPANYYIGGGGGS